MKPNANAKKYPLKLLPRTPVMLEAEVAKLLSSKKVVETGILNRVRIKRNRGAATCKKLNSLDEFRQNLWRLVEKVAYVSVKHVPANRYGD